ERHAATIGRAEAWLRRQPIENVVEAAAVLTIEPNHNGAISTDAGRKAWSLLRSAQSKAGGWGPYAAVPTEPFDTAIVLLALRPFRPDPAVRAVLDRGRIALAAMQTPDGSFPGSTRPPGGESYAQHISTTGW